MSTYITEINLSHYVRSYSKKKSNSLGNLVKLLELTFLTRQFSALNMSLRLYGHRSKRKPTERTTINTD